MKKYILTFVMALAGGIAALAIYIPVNRSFNESGVYFSDQAPIRQTAYTGPSPVTGPDFVLAADKSVHAVVHIKTEYIQKNTYYDDFFGYDPFFDFFRRGPYQSGPIVATGSGVIVSQNGYIVTNNHVVTGADKIEVTLNDKRTYEAKLIGTDPSTDLALIKIDETSLPFMVYGNSDKTRVGEWVLAVGNPFNLTSTVTAGIISAKARNINILGDNAAIESFIQTDAAVNPGNSGGALVNASGELIGINAAIASNTGSYTGYSFAIPVNIVRKVVADLIEFGQVQRAYMGINFIDMDSKFAKEKGFKDIKGVYVESVIENAAADKAGILSGDLILQMNGNAVNSESEFREALAVQSPGDKIMVTILRNGQTKNVEVTLENRDGNTDIVKTDPSTLTTLLGATFETVSPEEMKGLGIEYGIRIKKLETGKLRSAGIQEGFIITSIDNKPVRTLEDINKYLSGKSGGILMEGVYPNGMRAYYAFGL